MRATITTSEVAILNLIGRRALSGGEIAAELDISYPNVHNMLTRMLGQGVLSEEYVDDEQRIGLRAGEKRRKFRVTALGRIGIKFYEGVDVAQKAMADEQSGSKGKEARWRQGRPPRARSQRNLSAGQTSAKKASKKTRGKNKTSARA